MSQYGDTNPHFWSRSQPDFAAPQHIQPEPRQPWDGHPYHPDQVQQPDMIQLRPRQRQPAPLPPPPPVRPPRSPHEHAHQQPLSPPRHHRPVPVTHFHPVEGPAQTHTPSQARPKPKPQSHQPRPQNPSFGQGAPPPSREDLMYPTPNRTKPITWFGAVFCVILWLVIILGGLLVLIIYLVYRPRTPHFEIASASLNAAYLDLGYLLNSDLTVLANFTNPNEKVNVDFSYVVLQLYFDRHLIANQYIEPFSAFNTESKLANVEFVSSQVRLPIRVIQQLITQVQRNRVTFEVDGIFHARSNFGSLLRYSYWLYGHCQIELTGPPTGVMLTSHCRTKD